MSQRISYTCDRCQKVDDGAPPLQLQVYGPGGTVARDLCSACIDALVEWIDRRIG